MIDRREMFWMAKVTISMPDSMRAYVSKRIAPGQYGNVSEYFRDLVRHDQERIGAMLDFRDILDRAEASGISDKSMDEIKAEVRRAHGP